MSAVSPRSNPSQGVEGYLKSHRERFDSARRRAIAANIAGIAVVALGSVAAIVALSLSASPITRQVVGMACIVGGLALGILLVKTQFKPLLIYRKLEGFNAALLCVAKEFADVNSSPTA